MNNENEELNRNLPLGISPTISMNEPNQRVDIHEGIFSLLLDQVAIEVEGNVWFNWLPHINTRFNGVIKLQQNDLRIFSKEEDRISLVINGLIFGEAYITNITEGETTIISGQMYGISVLGDRSIPVSKIAFSLPNFREIYGLTIKKSNEKGGRYFGRNRIILDNKDYLITIDKNKDYRKLFKKLSDKGGFLLLYSGEIEKKSGHITFENLNILQHCFSTFLSFLNGQRCSPLFLQGIHESEIVWSDYTGYTSDLFISVHSWLHNYKIDGLNELWNEFYELWSDENDKNFLVSIMHWHVEANSNSGYLEGSIVMIQTALELIYNWFIIEKRKLIHGKDGENISAANKIRLLLSQLKTNIDLPEAFCYIKEYLDSNIDIHDEIDLFVQIRNAIIHSQAEKRKKLFKISPKVKYEAQQLGLWYIEISLLKILKFKGEYRNRCLSKSWSKEDNFPDNDD